MDANIERAEANYERAMNYLFGPDSCVDEDEDTEDSEEEDDETDAS